MCHWEPKLPSHARKAGCDPSMPLRHLFTPLLSLHSSLPGQLHAFQILKLYMAAPVLGSPAAVGPPLISESSRWCTQHLSDSVAAVLVATLISSPLLHLATWFPAPEPCFQGLSVHHLLFMLPSMKACLPASLAYGLDWSHRSKYSPNKIKNDTG